MMSPSKDHRMVAIVPYGLKDTNISRITQFGREPQIPHTTEFGIELKLGIEDNRKTFRVMSHVSLDCTLLRGNTIEVGVLSSCKIANSLSTIDVNNTNINSHHLSPASKPVTRGKQLL